MNSILEPLRQNGNLDTPDEQCGIACGRRWAQNSALPEELLRLAAFSTCPGFASWFQEDASGYAIMTPERLVDIIGDATHTSLESVDFWNQHFGASERHAAIWRTPAFLRGFVWAAVAEWKPQDDHQSPGRPTGLSLY